MTSDAAAYPERPITVAVPFGAGVAIEVLIRAVCEEAAKNLGQPIIVGNRSGALQRLPVLAVRRAVPAGYTLAVGTDSVHVADHRPGVHHAGGQGAAAALIALPLVLVSILPHHSETSRA